MDPKQITKQMIDFNKAAYDNTFNAMSMLQDQTEKMVEGFLAQSPWIPAEGKKTIQDWVKSYKKGRDTYKSTADENFKKVEDFFSGMTFNGKAK